MGSLSSHFVLRTKFLKGVCPKLSAYNCVFTDKVIFI